MYFVIVLVNLRRFIIVLCVFVVFCGHFESRSSCIVCPCRCYTFLCSPFESLCSCFMSVYGFLELSVVFCGHLESRCRVITYLVLPVPSSDIRPHGLPSLFHLKLQPYGDVRDGSRIHSFA